MTRLPGAVALPDNIAGGADGDLQRGVPRPAAALQLGAWIGR